MERQSRTIQQFLEAVADVKLSYAQTNFVNKLKAGYHMKLINTHWKCGGIIVWIDKNGDQEDAGHIYKAMQTAMFKTNTYSITDLFI